MGDNNNCLLELPIDQQNHNKGSKEIRCREARWMMNEIMMTRQNSVRGANHVFGTHIYSATALYVVPAGTDEQHAVGTRCWLVS